MPRGRALAGVRPAPPFPRRSGRKRACAAAVCAILAAWAAPVLASPSEMREAGERYAANDTPGAIAALDGIIDRKGGTSWVSEALLLRALIREKDLGERKDALEDLRRLSVRFAGSDAAVFGQFHIARIYEEGGLLADAYREYVLCSRMQGLSAAQGRSRKGDSRGGMPSHRITPEGAADLVRVAAARAAVLFGRIPAAGVGLPPATFVATGPACEIEVPADPRTKSASGERTDACHVVAPHGKSISAVAARLEAAVDPAAAGPDSGKYFRILIGALPQGVAAGRLALFGARREPEEHRGQLALPDGAGALQVALARNGARILRLRLKVEVRDAPPGPPRAPPPPAGFAFAVPPVDGGAGGATLARLPGRFVLVWHSPRDAGAAADADLHIATSPDGASWSEPARLAVSSAVDDRDPSLGCLAGGRLLLAWTSDRRGPGTSDVYLAESADGAKWTKPALLEISPRDLESMGPRMISGGTGVPSAFVTLHRPVVSIDSKGAARVFFVAHGTRYTTTGSRSVARLGATGVYAVVSTDLKTWSKPVAIVSTPITALERYRPAPRTREREAVSNLGGPSVIERSPGRSLVSWVSTCGRAFLTQRDQAGEWAHFDTKFAGAKAEQAAQDVELLGPFPVPGGAGAGGGGDAYGVLLIRRDLAPKVVWRDAAKKEGWSVEDVEKAAAPGAFAEVAAVMLEGGRSWLTAWTSSAAAGPGGVCVRRIDAPPPPAPPAPPAVKRKP